jgi:hypothetical protein
VNLPQCADLRKRHAEKPNNILHAQSIRSRLNSYNFAAGLDYGKTTGSIVCTIAAGIVRAMILNSARFTDIKQTEKERSEFEQQKRKSI